MLPSFATANLTQNEKQTLRETSFRLNGITQQLRRFNQVQHFLVRRVDPLGHCWPADLGNNDRNDHKCNDHHQNGNERVGIGFCWLRLLQDWQTDPERNNPYSEPKMPNGLNAGMRPNTPMTKPGVIE